MVDWVTKWPTPKARDYRIGDKPESRRARMGQSGEWHSPDLNDVAAPGGALNPDWIEWLMGWPIGWTALEPLDRVKFRQWLQQFGGRWVFEPVSLDVGAAEAVPA